MSFRNGHYPSVLMLTLVILALGVCASADVQRSKGQTVYIPVYSHVYSGDREHPYYLSAILSIRNINLDRPITILAVDYHDSDGKLLKKHITGAQQMRPLVSVRYVVKESDKAGGSGAKFIVKWRADTDVLPPIIEGVMIGTKMQQGISFVTHGRVIEEYTD